jgi:raffinose/stachyose/melibiose transport system permease protein
VSAAAAPQARRLRRRETKLERVKRRWFAYVFGLVVPVLVYAIFVGYPLLYSIYLAFVQWDLFAAHKQWVGLANFRELAGDPLFWHAFGGTVKWTLGTLFVVDVLAPALAIFLNSGRVYMPGFFRMIFFIPVTMSLVAVGLMFSFIVSPAFGVFSVLFSKIGIGDPNVDLLGNPHSALYTLIAIFGWSYIGVALILFHAAVRQIPAELYEAVRLDGASGWQSLRHITLPMLRPIFMVVTMLSVLEALRAFDLISVMTRGGPGNASQVLGFLMYRAAFNEQRVGYGAAISTVMLALSMLFAIAYLRKVGRSALDGEA